ncbi:MAG TPA: hypothetical protein VF112_02100 [Candidatus Dormibacteraeota bacterium]
MTTSASIVHATSSRLRLRVDGDPAEVGGVLDSVAGQAAGHPGVNAVHTDLRTGSALLTWDPEQFDVEAAVELCRKADEALRDIVPPRIAGAIERPFSGAASRLVTRLSEANRHVAEASAGRIDLRFLVPAGFAALSVRQLMRTGPKVASMPWYALAYYAFDSFVKLHGTDRGVMPEGTG